MDPDRCLERRTHRRDGVFTLQDAEACGISRTTVYRRGRAGRYRRLQPRVFAIAAVPDSRRARLRAAELAVPEGVISHRSAGEIHGLPGCRRDGAIDVLVGRDRPTRFAGVAGIRVHRTLRLGPEHIVEVDGIRVAAPDRTLCDLAGVLDRTALRRAVAHAVREGLVTVASLRAVAGGLGRFRGKRALLAVLAELSPLEGATRNELESRFLAVTTEGGVPPTEMNHPVRDVDGVRRVLDAVYLPERIPVELDGQRWHGLTTDRSDDRRRENAVVLTGEWRSFLRFTWWQVFHEPEEVVATIERALDAARSGAGDRRT